jgi:hypothetical protein
MANVYDDVIYIYAPNKWIPFKYTCTHTQNTHKHEHTHTHTHTHTHVLDMEPWPSTSVMSCWYRGLWIAHVLRDGDMACRCIMNLM